MNTTSSVIVFDVNETLSDMSPMENRFVDIGAPGWLARVWFAALLRDGFALAASGGGAEFSVVGADILRDLLRDVALTRTQEDAVTHVMYGLMELDLHPDIADGVRTLKEAGYRLATLSNGSAQVAETLLARAAIRDEFDAILTVEDAPAWKPVRSAYQYAADACGVQPADMLLVAVHPWDIHGAAQAGLRTAWLNRTDAVYPRYFATPDYTIAALSELAGSLQA
jgi:2-haloacid dehalogenase